MLIADGGGGYSFHLDPTWPGLDSGDKIEVDRDELKKIIRILQDDLDSYSEGSQGTLNDLQTRGAKATVAELGQYPAAQGLAQSTAAAQSQIGGKYGQFLASYGSVIDALRKAAGAYDDMEDQNRASVNRVSTSNSPVASLRNTSRFRSNSDPSAEV